MTKPLTPSEAKLKKAEMIPDVVIEAFNEIIAENLDVVGRSIFHQDDVIAKILAKAPEDWNSNLIFNKRWLDVEPVYRRAGWHVTYENGDYREPGGLFKFVSPAGDE